MNMNKIILSESWRICGKRLTTSSLSTIVITEPLIGSMTLTKILNTSNCKNKSLCRCIIILTIGEDSWNSRLTYYACRSVGRSNRYLMHTQWVYAPQNCSKLLNSFDQAIITLHQISISGATYAKIYTLVVIHAGARCIQLCWWLMSHTNNVISERATESDPF